MNLIDLRNSVAPVDQNSNFESLPNETLNYLKNSIPRTVADNATELVKAVHNLIWNKGIPIYLVDEYQMPDDFKRIETNHHENEEPPTEILGYYKYIDLGTTKCESIFLCMERIGDHKQKLAKVLIHELGHALMEAGTGDYGYNFNNNDIVKFMEESLANYIVLQYFNDIKNIKLLDYSKNFISNQGFGYNFGIVWFDNVLIDYNFWIKAKKSYTNNHEKILFDKKFFDTHFYTFNTPDNEKGEEIFRKIKAYKSFTETKDTITSEIIQAWRNQNKADKLKDILDI